jgi:hypothetical protein
MRRYRPPLFGWDALRPPPRPLRRITKTAQPGVTIATFDLGYDIAGNVTSRREEVSGNSGNGTWSRGGEGRREVGGRSFNSNGG